MAFADAIRSFVSRRCRFSKNEAEVIRFFVAEKVVHSKEFDDYVYNRYMSNEYLVYNGIVMDVDVPDPSIS